MFHIQGQLRSWKLLLCILLSLTLDFGSGLRRRSDCSTNEYWSDGLCCDKCAPGYKLVKECSSVLSSQCEECENGTYLDKRNYFPNCFRCEKCTKRNVHSLFFDCFCDRCGGDFTMYTPK